MMTFLRRLAAAALLALAAAPVYAQSNFYAISYNIATGTAQIRVAGDLGVYPNTSTVGQWVWHALAGPGVWQTMPLTIVSSTASITGQDANGYSLSVASGINAGNGCILLQGGEICGPTVGGVSQIIAGTAVTISPSNGLGAVTINATDFGPSTATIYSALNSTASALTTEIARANAAENVLSVSTAALATLMNAQFGNVGASTASIYSALNSTASALSNLQTNVAASTTALAGSLGAYMPLAGGTFTGQVTSLSTMTISSSDALGNSMTLNGGLVVSSSLVVNPPAGGGAGTGEGFSLTLNPGHMRILGLSTFDPFQIDGSTLVVKKGAGMGIGTLTPAAGTMLDVNGAVQFGSTAKSTFTAAGQLQLPAVGIKWADGSTSTTAASGGGGGGGGSGLTFAGPMSKSVVILSTSTGLYDLLTVNTDGTITVVATGTVTTSANLLTNGSVSWWASADDSDSSVHMVLTTVSLKVSDLALFDSSLNVWDLSVDSDGAYRTTLVGGL